MLVLSETVMTLLYNDLHIKYINAWRITFTSLVFVNIIDFFLSLRHEITRFASMTVHKA